MSPEQEATLAAAAERLEHLLLTNTHIPTKGQMAAAGDDPTTGRDAPGGYKKGETIFDGVKAGNLLQTFIDDLYAKEYPGESVPRVADYRLRIRDGRDHSLLQIAIKETFS